MEKDLAAVIGHNIYRNDISLCPGEDGEGIYARWLVKF